MHLQPRAPFSYEIYKIGDQGQFDTEAEDAIIGHLNILEPAVSVADIPTTLPAEFSHKYISADEATVHRDVRFSVLQSNRNVRFVVNGLEFQDGRVNHHMGLGTVEDWHLENEHPGMS